MAILLCKLAFMDVAVDAVTTLGDGHSLILAIFASRIIRFAQHELPVGEAVLSQEAFVTVTHQVVPGQ